MIRPEGIKKRDGKKFSKKVPPLRRDADKQSSFQKYRDAKIYNTTEAHAVDAFNLSAAAATFFPGQASMPVIIDCSIINHQLILRIV